MCQKKLVTIMILPGEHDQSFLPGKQHQIWSKNQTSMLGMSWLHRTCFGSRKRDLRFHGVGFRDDRRIRSLRLRILLKTDQPQLLPVRGLRSRRRRARRRRSRRRSSNPGDQGLDYQGHGRAGRLAHSSGSRVWARKGQKRHQGPETRRIL